MTVQIYPPSRTVDQHRVRPALASQPPLYAGDRLSRVEFERRYHAHPEIKKAELVEGIVYMPSPARFSQHSQPQADVITWLGMYRSVTPGVMVGDNATLRHVPAKVVQVADIPRTRSGKIVELAVRNVVHGQPVKNVEALANAEALKLFANLPELAEA